MAVLALTSHPGSLAFVLAAGGAAGFIDSIVGGGGLVQMPALLSAYPNAPPALILGTNKLGSICGTMNSMVRYLREVRIGWRVLLPAMSVAFVMAVLGAILATQVSPAVFRPLVPVMLALVLLYVLINKTLGVAHAPMHLSRRRSTVALAVVALIGLYDGFFGPGAGSFLMLLFIRVYGFDYLHASAAARTVNVATNAGALLYFASKAEVSWGLGFALGLCNAVGSLAGAHTAIKHGSRFVRMFYIGIVLSLILKTAYDAYR